MPTTSQDKEFSAIMNDQVSVSVGNGALSDAIDYISHNFEPEDIFTVSELETWAENNGYVKE